MTRDTIRWALLVVLLGLVVVMAVQDCRAPAPARRNQPAPAKPDTVRPPKWERPGVPEQRLEDVPPWSVSIPAKPEKQLHQQTAARPLLAIARIEPRKIELTHVDSNGQVMVRTYPAIDRIRYREIRIEGDSIVYVRRTRAGRALAWTWHNGKYVLLAAAAGYAGYELAR